jgi:hypothetical protein
MLTNIIVLIRNFLKIGNLLKVEKITHPEVHIRGTPLGLFVL